MPTNPLLDPIILLDDQTVVGDGEEVNIYLNGIRGMYGLAQCSISGSATAVLYGRLDDTFPWQEIKSFTSGDAIEVTLFNQMKAAVTTGSTFTVRLGIIGRPR